MPRTLCWTGPPVDLRSVHNTYVDRCRRALADFIERLDHDDKALASRILLKVDAAPQTHLRRVMLAPRTSYYLFAAWPSTHSATTVAHFLWSSLTVEEARAGHQRSVLEPTWSALGDCVLEPSGVVQVVPAVESLVPLDTGSPCAIGGDLGAHYQSPLASLDADEIALVAERLDVAAKSISATSPTAHELVTTFIKVLALRKAIPENLYSSGSDQQHPGRAVITNPQELDVVRTAEALIHEAIHALLYAQLEVVPWGFSSATSHDDKVEVVSPWTGTSLSPSAYLHACFVWFGLLNFWCLALQAGSFDEPAVRRRMTRAAVGFLHGPLLKHLPPRASEAIDRSVREAIEEMQSRVLAVFSTTGRRHESSAAV